MASLPEGKSLHSGQLCAKYRVIGATLQYCKIKEAASLKAKVPLHCSFYFMFALQKLDT